MTVQDAAPTAAGAAGAASSGSAAGAAGVAGVRRKRPAEPEAYDFRRPMTLQREHGRILEMAFETFARQWGTLLTSRLRVVATVTVESVELRTYDEYVRSLPARTGMLLLAVEPGRSTGVVQVPVETLMVWVDYLLGGPGRPVEMPEHELTEIEWQLVRDLLAHALRDLSYAFAAVTPLEVALRSVQYSPQFVQATAASEPVVVTTFELAVADATTTVTLMLDADVVLASLKAGEKLDNRSADELAAHESATEALARQVHEVPVGVSVRMRPLTVAAHEISGLTVGDVVPMRHRADLPLDVVVGDKVLARAALGANGSRLAALVVTSEEKS